MKKKIDVIIPVWNSGQYIGSFIDGMLSQTYQDFHMYFVYDSSKDNTLSIIRSYQCGNEGRITILYSEKRCGQGAARDLVMDRMQLQGDYVIFLDADDYPEKNFLEKMVETAERYQVDLVMCGFNCFEDETGKIISTQMVDNTDAVISDLTHYVDIAYMNPAVWNKLYRREVAEKVRFGKVKSMEDGLYIAKILPYVRSIKIINEVLYHYRVSVASAQARMTADEFEERWSYYTEMAKYYGENQAVYAGYRELFEVMAFVKCAIGLTYRTALKDMRNLHYYISYSKKMLNDITPQWKENKSLQMRYCFQRPMKANAVACCAFLYKINFFSLFIIAYWLYQNLVHKEVRW
jgi:glycosyltransferase involved in cell wall biosynthesis